jgi:hypothetical protein
MWAHVSAVVAMARRAGAKRHRAVAQDLHHHAQMDPLLDKQCSTRVAEVVEAGGLGQLGRTEDALECYAQVAGPAEVGLRQEPVALDHGDASEVVGEHPRCEQAGDATADNNGVGTVLALRLPHGFPFPWW